MSAEAPYSATSRVKAGFSAIALLAGGAFTFWLWWNPIFPGFTPRTLLAEPVVRDGRAVAIAPPGYVPIAELAHYRDELFAYLMFDYLRNSPGLEGSKLLLTYNPGDRYRLLIRGNGSDLTASLDAMIAMNADAAEWVLWPEARVLTMERQTRVFESAYSMPVKHKLEELPRAALSSYLRRFIRFKSTIDPRVRRRIEPIPQPLTSDDAQHLAGDILTIAEFFSLPLDYFLGIGAMENNYMNVGGDLQHSVWKRRAAPDDVVLERRRGRVRVLNDSAGVWQITRETLRDAHRLVRRDSRDYGQLPEHLRPPKEFRMDEVSPQVLTTYAGMLLRDLLDHFHGDVTLAVSAYNGGKARPNLRYGAGVERAAAHARRVLEQSAALNGESVVRMTWLRP